METETRKHKTTGYDNSKVSHLLWKTLLNSKKTSEGWMGGDCQVMADGNKQKWTLDQTMWPKKTHTLESRLPDTCEKYIFRFIPQPAGNHTFGRVWC